MELEGMHICICIVTIIFKLTRFLLNRQVSLAENDIKREDIRTAILDILSPSSLKGFDPVLQEEARVSVEQLIRKTQNHGNVDPLSFIRCTLINVILSTAFGNSGVKSPNDPLYKCIMGMSRTNLQYIGIFNNTVGFFSIMPYLNIFSRKRRKMRNYVNNVDYPLVQKLIQNARESSRDNLIKRIDLLKEEYDIDEKNIAITMGKLYQITIFIEIF